MADSALSRRALISRAAIASTAVTIAIPTFAVSAVALADPIPAAWASYRAGHLAYSASFDDELGHGMRKVPYAQLAPILERIDEATETLLDHRAATPAAAAMKLRRAFIALNQSEVGDRLALGTASEDDRRHLRRADLGDRLLWSAIEDLERMAGQ